MWYQRRQVNGRYTYPTLFTPPYSDTPTFPFKTQGLITWKDRSYLLHPLVDRRCHDVHVQSTWGTNTVIIITPPYPEGIKDHHSIYITMFTHKLSFNLPTSVHAQTPTYISISQGLAYCLQGPKNHSHALRDTQGRRNNGVHFLTKLTLSCRQSRQGQRHRGTQWVARGGHQSSIRFWEKACRSRETANSYCWVDYNR